MSRPTSFFRVFVICAAVLTLMLGAAGIAVASDDPITTDTTESTEPPTTTETTPPVDDTTPPVDDTTPPVDDTTPPVDETTTTTTMPSDDEPMTLFSSFAANESGFSALAASPNRVEVTKAVQPGDPSTSFSITLERCTIFFIGCIAWGESETLNVTPGSPVEFSKSLANNNRYRITETVPSGWSFVSASCTGGSATSITNGVQFQHTTNASWNCTFENANNRVTITKASDGPDPATIALQRCTAWVLACLGWQNIDSSAYSNGTSKTFESVSGGAANIYRVVETVPDGYRLTSVSCTGGSSSDSRNGLFGPIDGKIFTLDASSPTRNCTFTNTQNRITVTKATDPSGLPTSFEINIEKCDVNIFANCLLGWYGVDGSPVSLSDGQSVDIVGGDLADPELFNRFFRVRESNPGSVWDVDVQCTGQFAGTSSGNLYEAFTFSLDQNVPATANCVVTNSADVGSITITKATDPDDTHANEFGFTFDDELFSLTTGQSEVFDNLLAGTYTIVETELPAGWELDDIDCGDADTEPEGDYGVDVTLGEGEHVECTFTNETEYGSITVAKATEPNDNHGSEFGFTFDDLDDPNDPAPTPFSLESGGSQAFSDLLPSGANGYEILESSLPAGWDLDGVDCGDADTETTEGGVRVLLDAGEDVTCTFGNVTETGSITVVKETSPEAPDGTEFGFTFDDLDDPNDPEPTPFTLESGDSREFDGLIISGTNGYQILEPTPSPGWTLGTITCINVDTQEPANTSVFPGEGVTVFLGEGQDVECTFENTTTLGSITVQKVTDPAGGIDFGFEFANLDDQSDPPATQFTLDDDQSETFSDLFPSPAEGYEILETDLPDGWELDDIDCGAAQTTPLSNGVVVLLQAGENVVCTFENVNPTEPAISMTKTPDPTAAIVGDTITYTYVVTNEGPVPVSDLTVVDTPLGPVELDTTTLAPAGQPGDSATGTLTRAVTDADAGTTITNTALANGLVSCNPDVEICAAEREHTEVTAEAEASVGVAAVGGEVVTGDGGASASSATTGRLPFTGSDPWAIAAAALALVLFGGLLMLLERRRQHGLNA